MFERMEPERGALIFGQSEGGMLLACSMKCGGITGRQ